MMCAAGPVKAEPGSSNEAHATQTFTDMNPPPLSNAPTFFSLSQRFDKISHISAHNPASYSRYGNQGLR